MTDNFQQQLQKARKTYGEMKKTLAEAEELKARVAEQAEKAKEIKQDLRNLREAGFDDQYKNVVHSLLTAAEKRSQNKDQPENKN